MKEQVQNETETATFFTFDIWKSSYGCHNPGLAIDYSSSSKLCLLFVSYFLLFFFFCGPQTQHNCSKKESNSIRNTKTVYIVIKIKYIKRATK